MKDLSILIPSRNEEFLRETIGDICKNAEADTEVIVTLDGQWADPSIPQHERVNIIYVPESVGQRAATNLACKLSRAKYVAKCDAHCAFDKGFDRKMLEAFEEAGDNVVMVPIMRNLWAFDWKCPKCGKRTYQDKENICSDCGTEMEKEMLWRSKHNPQSTSYCFDAEPKFRYFEDWKHRPQYIEDKAKTGLTETMSLQGSFFMCTRKMYLNLNLCDEAMGSWGNQGIEVAGKAWLSGGRVLCNHKTWYAHMFRTKVGTFGFPWPVSGRAQMQTKKRVRDFLWSGKWKKQVHSVSWLVRRFWPVNGWSEADVKRLELMEGT